MAWVDAQLSRQFYAWEQAGRGFQVWPAPVAPEPPFRSFPGYALPKAPYPVDDGLRPTALSSWFRGLSQKLAPQAASPPSEPEPEQEEEPEPEPLRRGELVELPVSLPAQFDAEPYAFAAFLGSLAYLHEPIAFELLGLPEKISLQFVLHPADVGSVQRQLQAHFPEVVFTPQDAALPNVWAALDGAETAVVEFGLGREFALPLSAKAPEILVGLIAALEALEPGELGLFQVLFEPVRNPWAQSLFRAIADDEGKPVFVNAPGLLVQGKRKVSQPLFAAVVRLAVRSNDFSRAWAVARDLASSLGNLADVQGNELIPLSNDDYPFEDHVEDVWRRQSRRSGMILNQDELLALVHLPTAAVHSAKLARELTKTHAIPKTALAKSGLLLGFNRHAGKEVEVRLSPDERVRHMHVIGASGTGKSTLLFNLICQDIQNGEGLAVLDPHGDLVDRILGNIPEQRIPDVVVLDPSDDAYSVGFNILSAHSDLEKNLLASDLVSVFQRLSTSWGDQMGSVLQNAILAFLESSQGGTLADLRRFLLEPAVREKFLTTVKDPDIVYYWRKGFPQLSGNKSIGPVLTRLETFLSPKPIRYLVSQKENRLDFAEIMDSGKILLAKLPQGQMGKENSFLLGSLLVAKFQQLVMGRQAQRIESRRPFYLYLDEFQNFITPSMAEILTGARKYRLGLILAHQELRQLQRDSEVASAVLSNPYTRIVFRVGDADAKALEGGFAHFETSDLQNLSTGTAIGRLERSDHDFNLRVPLPEERSPQEAEDVRNRVITASREKYATPRAEIEALLLSKLEAGEARPEPTKRKDAPQPASVLPQATEAKAAPVPEVTVPGKGASIPVAPVESKPTVQPVSPAETAPSKVEERGIGGNQHNLIRERIEAVARTLGYYPAREKLTPDGGKIDVALEHGKETIACEISFSTTIDHEVGNVAKCLKTGCAHVAVITTSEARLAKIQQAVSVCLPAEEFQRVGFYLPDQFLEYLKSRKPVEPAAPAPTEVKLGKYRVKSRASKLTPAEQREREATAIKLMADTMRRKK